MCMLSVTDTGKGFLLSIQPGETHLESSSCSGIPSKTQIWVYWSGVHAKTIKGSKDLSHTESLKELRLFGLKKRRKDLKNVNKYLL